MRRFVLFGILSLVFCGQEDAALPILDTSADTNSVGHTKKNCGDGTCNEDRENFLTCPSDCRPYCGDGVCSNGETKWTCWADCQPHVGINPNIFNRPDRNIFDPPGD